MEKQTTETGLSPVRIEEGDTLVYCSMPGCSNQIDIRIGGPGVEPYYTFEDPEGRKHPLCEGCAIEH